MQDLIAEKQHPTRSYGIDLLRILAMFFIVSLHLLDDYEFVNSVHLSSKMLVFVQWLYCISLCGVNIFAIVSGYVMYSDKRKKFNPKKIVMIWFQTFFIMNIVTLVAFFFDSDHVTKAVVIQSLFPFFSNTAWYFTAYCMMFFFIPFLNDIVRESSPVRLKTILSVILIYCLFYSFREFFQGRNAIELLLSGASINKGFSAVWLALMYIVGATIRKLDLGANWKKSTLILVILLLTLLSSAYRTLLAGNTMESSTLPLIDDISYLSPNVLITSILFVILFAKIKIQSGSFSQRFLTFLTPSIFAVYILHTHVYFWDRFSEHNWAFPTPIHAIVIFILAQIGIFAASVLIDRLRIGLVTILHLEEKLDSLFSKLDKRLKNRFNLPDQS